MLDENQIVKMSWQRGNKAWFISKGYKYTKIGDEFNVFVKDLRPQSHVKVNVICDYCGAEYRTYFYNLTNMRKKRNKDACDMCKYKKTSELATIKNSKKLLGKAKDLCEQKGYELLTKEDEYTSSHMAIYISCSKHGKQPVNLWALLNGAGCPMCARETTAIKNTFDKDYVEQYINSINGNTLLNKEDYKTKKTHNLDVRCACGKVYTTSLACYELGAQQCYSCSCKESVGERKIRNFFERNHIYFEKEKKFDDCRDKLLLPFDFYLPQNNLIIEFDGQQHYEPVFGQEEHETTKKHDKIKNQYCKDNNIDLLRIPYWEGNNIESIIATKLNL